MPYVKRNADDRIVSIAQTADNAHSEYLQPTANEIVNFLSDSAEIDLSKDALAESDKDIARITEDLIQLLISKNIILFTELPGAVQQKLLSREKLRSSLNGVMDDFLDDEESI
ncbi:MAG: hypothetical protein AAFZ92_10045 [Pseudomonadota bacterium]